MVTAKELPPGLVERLNRGQARLLARRRGPGPLTALPCLWAAALEDLGTDFEGKVSIDLGDIDDDGRAGWVRVRPWTGCGGVFVEYAWEQMPFEPGAWKRTGHYCVAPFEDAGVERLEYLRDFDEALALSWELTQKAHAA